MNLITETLLSPIAQIIVLFFTSLITWFFSRSKYKKDLRSQDIDNEIKSANYYKGLLDDVTNRLKRAVEELVKLEGRFLELMKANRELQLTNIELRDTNRELLETNRELLGELRKYKQLNGKTA